MTSQNGNASVAPYTVSWTTSVIALTGISSLAAGAWPTNHGNVQNTGRQAPTATASLVAAGTSATVTWTQVPGSEPLARTVGWYRDNGGAWTHWTDTIARSSPSYGVAGHTYDFYGQGATAQNIVRGISVIPGSAATGAPGAYIVDLFGGIHRVGAAPYLTPPNGAYWPGWDIARGLATTPDGRGGYVLDGWGGLHWFGPAGAVAPPTSGGAYWPGWDIARSVAVEPGTTHQGWVIDAWGGFHEFGGAPAVVSYLPLAVGRDLSVGVSSG